MEHHFAALVVTGFLLVAGAVLGRWRALYGLFLLLAVVVPTSSLAWYLGLPNLATTLAFSLGLLGGATLARWQGDFAGIEQLEVGNQEDCTHAAVGSLVGMVGMAFLLTVVVSVTVALCRLLLEVPGLASSLTGSALASLHLASPPDPARSVHYALMPLIGLGTFFLVARLGRDSRARDSICRAWLVGATLTVCAPVVQDALSWPLVARPDNPNAAGTGWIAFFQDPHALGAYLVLVIGLAGGLLVFGRWSRNWHAALPGLLVVAACGVLVMTDSRTAILGGVAAVWTLSLIATANVGPDPRRSWALAALLTIAIPVGAVVLTHSENARWMSSELLHSVGAPRVAASLEPDMRTAPLESRRTMWRRAFEVSLWYPVAGVGPGNLTGSAPADMIEASVEEIPSIWLAENAHNYFLQLAAEFGWPSAICFTLWWVAMLAAGIRSVRHPELSADRARAAGITSGMVGFTAVLMAAHPLLLAELQVAVFALAALALPRTDPIRHERRSDWSRKALIGGAAVYVAFAGVELTVGTTLRDVEVRSWGVHGWEDVHTAGESEAVRYRWISDRAHVIGSFDERFLGIPLRIERADLEEEPIDVRVHLNGVFIDEIHATSSPSSTRLVYDLPALQALVGDAAPGSPTDLGFEVSSSVRPSHRSDSSDHRLLGVQLGQIEEIAELGEGGVGWHEWEYDPALERAFRWSRRWSSIPLVSSDGRLSFEIRANHPALSQQPVTVHFVWDGVLLHEARLTASRWTPIDLVVPADRPGVLTVHASRTWIPSAHGASEDDRALGVAVTEVR